MQDTGTYWSVFGQAVILLLIQIGGLGVVTVAASLALLSGRKITLLQRSTMQEAFKIAPGKNNGRVKQNGKMDMAVRSDTVLAANKTMLVLGEY